MKRYAFTSDLEGNFEKWQRLIEDSPDIFYRDSQGIALRDGVEFIYGGDLIDRAPGALRLIKDLLALKKRYSERVTLLAGNRDINKIFFLYYLSPKYLNKAYEEAVEFFINTLSGEEKKASKRVLISKWMLKSFNAPRAFEFRKEELEILQGRSVSEDEVVDSFLEDLREGGALYEYLQEAQVMYSKDGNTFVHGAILDSTLGYVPRLENLETNYQSWILKLNAWYKASIAQLKNVEFMDNYRRSVLADLLIYHGGRSQGRSVIYSRYSDANGNQVLPSQNLRAYLRQEKQKRVIHGHTPVGFLPTIMRDEDLEFVNGDNSENKTYSLIVMDSETIEIRGEKVEDIHSADSLPSEALRYRVGRNERTPLGLKLEQSQDLILAPWSKEKWLALLYRERYQRVYRLIDKKDLAAKDFIECQRSLF